MKQPAALLSTLALLATLSTLVLPAQLPAAGEAPPHLQAYDWLSRHQDEALDMLRQAKPEAADVLERMGDAWLHREGAVALELADLFVEAICYNAPALIRSLRENMEAFNDWLERVPALILTDYRGNGLAHMEALKNRLISCIDEALKTEQDQGIRDGLIVVRERFANTKVRLIDQGL